MSSKKYKQGDQLVVIKGQLSGVVGCCVGYDDSGMVKIGFSLGDGEGCLAVLTIPVKNVSLVAEVV